MTAAVFDLEGALLHPVRNARCALAPLREQAREMIAEHRLRRHFILLLSTAAREEAERLAGELRADAVILAERYADQPQWRRGALAEFCRRYQLAADRSFGYGSCLADAHWLELLAHRAIVLPPSRGWFAGWKDPDRPVREQALASGWKLVDLETPLTEAAVTLT